MDQERNEFNTLGQDALEEAPVDAPEQEDGEIAEIKAEAAREMAEIEQELAQVDERLELEYATLGRRAFEFAQTDEVIASKLGVALAAVTAQTENRGKLSRSLEALEKKTADRIADVIRAREAEEADRRFEEGLARKEAAAQEAMERARALEREAAEARRAREESRREADAAVLAASQTMLISFTDDVPDISAYVAQEQQDAEPEPPEAAEAAPVSDEGFEPEAPMSPEPEPAAELSPEPEAPAAWEAEPEAEPALEPNVEPEPESLLAPEPAPESWFVAEPESELETLLAPEPADDFAADAWPQPDFGAEDVPEADAVDEEAQPESLLAPEPAFPAFDTPTDSGFDAEPEAAEPVAAIDPNATLLLDDYGAQPSWQPESAEEMPAVDPKATLLLDDEVLNRSDTESEGASESEPAAQIVCPTCGSPCAEGDFFCLKCGTKLDGPSAPVAEPASAPELDSDVYAAPEPAAHEYPVFGSEPEPEPEPELEHTPRHAAPAVPTCVSCGHELQPGDKFCMFCGARQEAAPAPAPAAPMAPVASTNICSGCGFELQPGDKFCMQCGKPAQQVPTDAAPAVPAAKICPNCGAEYTDADKFCMMCGYRL